jgi:hypothetical protein
MHASRRAFRALGLATTMLALAAAGRAGAQGPAAVNPCPPPSPLALCRSEPTGVSPMPANDPFAKPQRVEPLYELDFPGSFHKASTYSSLPDGSSVVLTGTDGSQIFPVENPWLSLSFTVQPGNPPPPTATTTRDYLWNYDIGVEACLYSTEVQAWGNAQDTGADCSGLRPVSPTSTSTHWYSVGDQGEQGIEATFRKQPHPSFQVTIDLKTHTPATTIRIHGKASSVGSWATGYAPGFNTYSDPIHVVVLPAALVQDKVLPSTILYNPPGANSQAGLALASSYTTVVTGSDNTEIDTTNTDDEWVELDAKTGTAKTGSQTVLNLFDAAFQLEADEKWDHATTTFTGQATIDTTAYSQGCSTTFTDGVGQSGRATVPGAAGSYANEPFWGDHVEVLVHPQFALWDFYGTMTMQLLGADGVCGVPPLHAISVFDLNLCANPSATTPSGDPNPWVNGYPITVDEGPMGAVTETLNADDCRALANLDPFYASAQGQAADLSGRATFLHADGYGVPGPGQPDITKMISEGWSQSVTNTHEVDKTVKATVQDIHATKGSAGLTVTAGGLDTNVTLSAGVTTTNATTQSLVYKNATAQTITQTTTITGSLDDRVYRGYEPQVEFWQDDIFGTPLYRDPQAQGQPTAH